jgi:hypothetical protein
MFVKFVLLFYQIWRDNGNILLFTSHIYGGISKTKFSLASHVLASSVYHGAMFMLFTTGTTKPHFRNIINSRRVYRNQYCEKFVTTTYDEYMKKQVFTNDGNME